MKKTRKADTRRATLGSGEITREGLCKAFEFESNSLYPPGAIDRLVFLLKQGQRVEVALWSNSCCTWRVDFYWGKLLIAFIQCENDFISAFKWIEVLVTPDKPDLLNGQTLPLLREDHA